MNIRRFSFQLFQTLLSVLILLLLAVVTQIGAMTYVLVKLISLIFKIKKIGMRFVLNILMYALFTFWIVPNVAPIFGRVPIQLTEHLKPTNYVLTVALNRHYVVPELNEVLQNVSKDLKKNYPSMTLQFLDANFPFFTGFPLLPHLSHNDGRKVDVSFIYNDNNHQPTNLKPSFSGYGVFVNPNSTEKNTTKECQSKGFGYYDYPKYFSLGSVNEGLLFADSKNKTLINLILSHDNVKKLFVEPHLNNRLKLNNNRIRFQGCHSVRHDDHIHFQI